MELALFALSPDGLFRILFLSADHEVIKDQPFSAAA